MILKDLQNSGLVGNTLAIATQTAMSLPAMIVAGGAGNKLMAGTLAQLGPEGMQKALPTIYKIFKNDAAAVKFITESANMAAGFGSKGAIEGAGTSPTELQRGVEGIVTAPFYSVGPSVAGAITPKAAGAFTKGVMEYAGAGTGMALPTAIMGGNPAAILQSFLTGGALHGIMTTLDPKAQREIEEAVKNPTPENAEKAMSNIAPKAQKAVLKRDFAKMPQAEYTLP